MGNNVVRSAVVIGAVLSLVASGVGGHAEAQAPTVAAVTAKTVTLDVAHASLEYVLREIARQGGLTVVYSDQVVQHPQRVTLSLRGISVPEAFERALAGTALRAAIVSGNVLIESTEARLHGVRQGHLVGKVISAKTREPVVGVTIVLDDARQGVVSGPDGSFRMVASVGTHTVRVRGVGFVHQAKKVTVTEGETVTITFTMEPTASVLDEVIVTGTVVATERRAIPNPITVFTAEDLERRGITRIEELFRGEVPGVVALDQGTGVYSAGAELGAMQKSTVYARSSASLNGGANPLKTFVDGVELLDPSYPGTVDPKSIERIEIISGPQAATIYGSGAIGGVMQIFTKRGNGNRTPDLSLTLKYGMLESNLSNGRTPTHDDVLSVTGGAGPEFSYSATLAYRYQGQWQPYLFSRNVGASVGVTHTRGPVVVSGSWSGTNGWNGTFPSGSNLRSSVNIESGAWSGRTWRASQIRAVSQAQTLALNADYRMSSSWQQHVTLGRSQNTFEQRPSAPYWQRPVDSLFTSKGSNGQRTSVAYNLTALHRIQQFSLTSTLGLTGSSGAQSAMSGCLASRTASTYVPCYAGQTVDVTKPIDSRSWGGFGQWRLGWFDRLFITYGLRGERNPRYGAHHKIDWTPTNGITYSADIGNLTLKLLGSYGKSTREPLPEDRLPQVVYSSPVYEPNALLLQEGNPLLRPEYSRGPQGGIEAYWGDRVSFSVNHYQQTVVDLIQQVAIDSFPVVYVPTGGAMWGVLYRKDNVATIRQFGWESTMSFRFSRFTFKGTYSWMDGYILATHPKGTGTAVFVPGQKWRNVPSHTGNMVWGYAYGRSSALLTTSFIGAMNQGGTSGRWQDDLYYGVTQSRTKMYANRQTQNLQLVLTRPGYYKTNLSLSQRVTSTVSLQANVTNLTNSYIHEGDWANPALGRQTLIGISLRARGR